ncbi:UV DNA damage repair endonuclease UvsE [bacterium]|nr:MAG: UV DNA damage repair endonuclease UvsE [bacterium]
MPMAQIRRVGFACVSHDGALSTNHTLRLADLSPGKVAAAGHRNLDDMEKLLFGMARGPLRMFRLGGSTIPFASHGKMDFDWQGIFAGRLAELGSIYQPLGFRFSMHPGQYCVLNSLNPDTIKAAIREIDYAVTTLDLMGLDKEHKVIVHGGAVAGDREASTARLIENVGRLSQRLKDRLVLENDERLFSVEQIAPVGEATGVPIVFDIHHHRLNPGSLSAEDAIARVCATWGDVRPKFHISSQKPEARFGAHDDMVFPEDVDILANAIQCDIDLMVEAKAKEVAAMGVWRHLHGPQNG